MDLTAIAAGVGPGPYTGLRVGLVTARVLGAALGIPVYGVCTLDVIAADVIAADTDHGAGFLVATDARRREVYWAEYDGQGNRVSGPAVSAPADIPDSSRPVAGEGALLYTDLLLHSVGPAYPAAASLCRVAAAALRDHDEARLLPPEPLYLRRPDVREPHAPKRVSQA
jgi:tRNA threonylcarbamoyl adenosine modification protein YeaZ